MNSTFIAHYGAFLKKGLGFTKHSYFGFKYFTLYKSLAALLLVKDGSTTPFISNDQNLPDKRELLSYCFNNI